MKRRTLPPRGPIILLLASLTGCGGTESTTEPEAPVPTTVTLSPASLNFSSLGEAQQLTATVRDQNGTMIAGAPIAWASSVPLLASVSTTGLVTALADGTGTITATSGSVSGIASVTVLAVPMTLAPSDLCSEHADTDFITFEDDALEEAVRLWMGFLGLPVPDELTCGSVSGLTAVSNGVTPVSSLVGIQNLTALGLAFFSGDSNNKITDISPLRGLPLLADLRLDNNEITDFSPLVDLPSLTTLDLGLNGLTDISGLSGLTGLRSILLYDNDLTDINVLSEFTDLLEVQLWSNAITDITALRALTNLTHVFLDINSDLSDIQPLLDNVGIGSGDVVHLEFTAVSCADIAALVAKGVAVTSNYSAGELANCSPDPLRVTTSRLPSAVTGIPYSANLAAAGGDGTYAWTVPLGSLPTGLSLSGSTGVISGTPTVVETQNFTVEVASGAETAQQALHISVGTTFVLQSTDLCSDFSADAIATFEDSMLEGAIRSALGVGSQDDLTCALISGLTTLIAPSSGITSLVGIQNLTGLTQLSLLFNSITDISPLSGLTSLTFLDLYGNSISDIRPLSGLTNLTNLDLGGVNNSFADLHPLSGLTQLTVLTVRSNALTDVSTLSVFTGLTELLLESSAVSDIGVLSGLSALRLLSLDSNAITDISALSGLTSLSIISLRGNPNLSNIQPLLGNAGVGGGDTVLLNVTDVSCADVLLLEAKGVTVHSDYSASELSQCLPLLVLTTTSLPAGTTGVAYSETLTATGGDGTYTWSLTVGSLPTGLSLAASTGVISGTPTLAETQGFTVQVMSGDGQTAQQALSITVSALLGLTFQLVDAGDSHSCGVTTVGAAYCWGSNDNGGMLGDGTNISSSVPVAVSGGLVVQSLSAGGVHNCAVTTAGAAYCWGWGNFGQLGDGATSHRNAPVRVLGDLVFTAVRTGDSEGLSSCGVTTTGTAYCWGRNLEGQLGDGTNTGSSVPVAVIGGPIFETVSAGRLYHCGVTTTGAAQCWGRNNVGQLGNGANDDANAPVVVSGGLTFQSVSAGFEHSCGVTTTGAAYCWGANASGQLGNGANTDTNEPVAVAGGLTFQSVSAGLGYSCGVTTAGAAYCWGGNSSGGLGDGTNTARNEPVAVAGGLAFLSVSAGGLQSCGVTTAGLAYCWGSNHTGQLGDGTNTPSNVPVRVGG